MQDSPATKSAPTVTVHQNVPGPQPVPGVVAPQGQPSGQPSGQPGGGPIIAPPARVPEPGDDWNDPAWQDARTNIRWVLLLDADATERYNKMLNNGKSKYVAVLGAQEHNPNAHASIERYGEQRTNHYIKSLGL